MKKYHLMVLATILLWGCNKEPAIRPQHLVDVPKPFSYINFSHEASCLPFFSITVDTTVKWLDRLENPYQGRQEYGWAQAKIEGYNYEWNASARALFFDGNIIIALETFRSEENYYAFVERITFKISKDARRCTQLCSPFDGEINGDVSSASYDIGDWDIDYWNYLPDKNYRSQLEILELDTTNNYLKGKFDLQVAIDYPSGYDKIPDTIHFVNGVFECAIID